MTLKGDGLAVTIAVGAGLAIAVLVALSFGRPDYINGTYTFAVPATDHADERLVLVQGGSVTDVWISQADRDNEYYGHTPETPATALQLGDDSATLTREGDTLNECWFVGEPNEHCRSFEEIDRLSAGQAERLAAWAGLDAGTYTVESRSVTWDEGQTSAVTVVDGDPSELAGSYAQHLVRYWVHGTSAPFAVCNDDPNTYDEEECWVWSAAS